MILGNLLPRFAMLLVYFEGGGNMYPAHTFPLVTRFHLRPPSEERRQLQLVEVTQKADEI